MADATVDPSAEVKVKTERPEDGDEVMADPAGFMTGTVKIEDGTIKKEELDAKVKQEKKEEEKDIKVDGVKGEGVKNEGVKQEGNVKQEKRTEEDVKNEMKMEGTKREDFYALATKGEGAKGEVKGETKGEMKGEGVKGEGVKGESKRERSRSKKKKKKDKIKKEKGDGEGKEKKERPECQRTRKRKSKWGPDTGGFSMTAIPGGRSGLLPAAEGDETMPRFSDEEMVQRSLILENLSLSCTGQD
eukprot:s1563_g4.t1